MNVFIPLLILGTIAVAILYPCFIVSSQESRKEEEDQHPCATCVRWSECNGVDHETCPHF